MRVRGLIIAIVGLQICGVGWAQDQGANSKGQHAVRKQAVAPPCVIAGIVRDTEGKPLANASVSVKPALRKKLAQQCLCWAN